MSKDIIEEFKTNEAQENRFTRQPIGRIDTDVIKDLKRSRAGKKRKYTPVKFKNEANKYFEYCEKTDNIPTQKGLMLYMKMGYSSWANYQKYPEYRDLMDYVMMVINDWLEKDVYNTPGAAAGKLAYMKNNAGWRDKTEIEQIVTHRSVDEARAKIEALLPDLLEHIKRATINQKLPQITEATPLEAVYTNE
jgi:hypothetical protein